MAMNERPGQEITVDAYLPRLVEAGQNAGSPFYLAVAQANRAWASAQLPDDLADALALERWGESEAARVDVKRVHLVLQHGKYVRAPSNDSLHLTGTGKRLQVNGEFAESGAMIERCLAIQDDLGCTTPDYHSSHNLGRAT